MLKVVVYAICKNEEQFADRWVDSMSEADAIIVTDTGSTDNTVGRLRSRGVTVYEETITPWRFDVARNVSLSHVPEDADICLCTDLDEVLTTGWRNLLEAAWQQSIDQKGDAVARHGHYRYNWSHKSDGTPDVVFNNFKAHDRQGFTWHCPIHEYPAYTGTKPLERIFVEGMVLDHWPDDSKPRSSYLPLLEMAVREDPNDQRMSYYLGREYMFSRRNNDCIRELKRYLKLPHSRWREERCAAMRWIAESYARLEDYANAESWFFRAMSECRMREPFVELARLASRRENYALAYYLINEALKMTERSQVFTNSGYAWDATPHDLAAIAAYKLGMNKRALDHAKDALNLNPYDKRLAENVSILENLA